MGPPLNKTTLVFKYITQQQQQEQEQQQQQPRFSQACA